MRKKFKLAIKYILRHHCILAASLIVQEDKTIVRYDCASASGILCKHRRCFIPAPVTMLLRKLVVCYDILNVFYYLEYLMNQEHQLSLISRYKRQIHRSSFCLLYDLHHLKIQLLNCLTAEQHTRCQKHAFETHSKNARSVK